MTRTLLAATALLAAGSLATSGLAQDAGDGPTRIGAEVVIYTHLFSPDDYEAGRDLVVNGFSAAIQEADYERMTVFLENPDDHEVVAISFFGDEASVEEWHEFTGRLDVLEELEPLRREPMKLQKYAVIDVHEHE